MNASLEGKVVVVTGASRGIGRATALRLAEAGAVVAAVARDATRLEEVAAASDPMPGRVVAAPADVRVAADAERVVGETEEAFGRVDILVNNAGYERTQPLEEVSDADWDATVDTNLRGVFNFCRAVLPGMKARRSGHIVSVSSIAGIRGWREDAVYCATKFGVNGLMDALDEEVREHGIRVTSICPGAADTDLAASWLPYDDPYRPHVLQPVDVAEAIHYAVAQPPHVAVGMILVRPFVELPYSPMLPLDGV